MKKIVFIASLLIMLLSSCAGNKTLYKVGHVYRWAESRDEAYYKAGGHSLYNRVDKSGSFVQKSTFTNTTYKVDTGWLVAEGSLHYVRVTCQGKITEVNKMLYGTRKEWKIRSAGGHTYYFVIDVTRSGTFARHSKDGRIIGRYQF